VLALLSQLARWFQVPGPTGSWPSSCSWTPWAPRRPSSRVQGLGAWRHPQSMGGRWPFFAAFLGAPGFASG